MAALWTAVSPVWLAWARLTSSVDVACPWGGELRTIWYGTVILIFGCNRIRLPRRKAVE